MMTKNLNNYGSPFAPFFGVAQMRFTPCAGMSMLLKQTAATANCASGGAVRLCSSTRAGFTQFQNRRRRAVQISFMNRQALNSCGIFRGKMSQPETQPNLNERTQSAPSR